MNPVVHRIARRLHRFALLRKFAKRVARGRTVTQAFHGGVICLDAVEHSWAWTGTRTLEQFDRALQDRLHQLAATRSVLLDIGCSVGVMTLATLLRNPHMRAAAFDPNRRALGLLAESIRRNALEARATLHPVAISAGESALAFDAVGSFTGHVCSSGSAVPALSFPTILTEYGDGAPLVKIDIEGYEALLAETFSRIQPSSGSVFVIELHPAGFNGMGDPTAVVEAFRARRGVEVSLLGATSLDGFDPQQFQQVEVRW